MKPVVFSGHFGWLHPAAGDRGVVICNPMGHEAMWLHAAMRELAERISARGVSVLRFDYLGTGDSTDLAGALRPDAWVDEVLEAVHYLKRVTGVERISLAGFRYGATVAALASQLTEVDSLALLAPVVSTRLFLREMGVLHQAWRHTAGFGEGEAVTPPGARDILGHRFNADVLDTLGTLDLRKEATPHVKRVLLAHSGPRDPSYALGAHYEANGIEVASIAFDNYAQVMQPPWMTELPESVLSATTDWLSDGVMAPLRAPEVSIDSNPAIVTSGAIEYPSQIAQGRVFGMLCEPAVRRTSPEQTPIVLIANTAATHHVGDGRFGVELGRQLAEQGFASLRVDTAGLGDCAGAPQLCVPGHTVMEEMGADLSKAVDWVAARGYRNIVVFGICAGAYSALQAAQQNRNVRGVVLVNPVSLKLPEGCTMQAAAELQTGSPRAHLRSMVRANKWAQVLRGDVRLGPVIRTMWQHGVAQMQGMVGEWTDDALGGGSTPSHQVRRLFKRLDADGVHIRLLFSPRDHSLDELYMHFGVNGRRLKRLSRARTLIFPSMDHEVLDRVAREQVVTMCQTFLREAFLSGPSADVRPPVTASPGGLAGASHAAHASHSGIGANKDSTVERETSMPVSVSMPTRARNSI
ncbi:serine aminopeptidase domain-containing protein [Paraburkholderia sp. DHOC27]|uniref:serine aminopeptidase domain-containing protein n=1 Tax=Paraburkholderia sp. DHOC27 TaxID=2303330 RepID=UPI000E3D55AA|nr:alpha/beta hydrolase [Paraburkholderia sp. DHOC27]RFU46002.1 alpha/beta hydrolase [Paraburkholderia sp. DHOC27]